MAARWLGRAWVLAALVGGCHDYRVEPQPRPAAHAPGRAAAAGEGSSSAAAALHPYVISAASLRSSAALLPTATARDGGVLVEGLRVAVDGRTVAGKLLPNDEK